MKAFRQLMKIYEVTNYRACATSAMRDAQNGKSVIKKVWKDTGINIEVINGQEEARMIITIISSVWKTVPETIYM